MQYLQAITLATVVSLVINVDLKYSFLALLIFFNRPLWVFPGLLISLVLKKAWLLVKQKRRLKLLDEQVGKVLLLLSQTLKAGMSLDQGFRLVESSVDKPLKEELQLIIKEVDLGQAWINALISSKKRISGNEWQSFITAASLAINLGGNLAEILGGLANLNSQKEALARKIKSITAQGRLTAYILALLPLAFLGFYWVFDRDRILFFTSSFWGQIILVVAFLFDIAGFLAIRRICEVRW